MRELTSDRRVWQDRQSYNYKDHDLLRDEDVIVIYMHLKKNFKVVIWFWLKGMFISIHFFVKFLEILFLSEYLFIFKLNLEQFQIISA